MPGLRVLLLTLWTLAAVLTAPAHAFEDPCPKQRTRYPADWDDVSRETPLFTCNARGEFIQVRVGGTDEAGRTLMSLVPLRRGDDDTLTPTDGVYRTWLDREQTRRLRDGKYFATLVRREDSCWERGFLDESPLFFMDNRNPPADSARGGSFYNKAPRFSVFAGNAFWCEAAK
jgi:hypothetical protein